MEKTYFRKGFGLKSEIAGRLTADYHSAVVDALKNNGYGSHRRASHLSTGPGIRILLRRGPRGGIRLRKPDQVSRPAALFGRGNHSQSPCQRETPGHGYYPARPSEAQGEFDFSEVSPNDVVIMPAFGVTIGDFERLRGIGCVLVDTTCGSVLNVWKRVESYARDGYTALIHGKHYHEETKATASQVMKYPEGRYLVVFDMNEARMICDYIEGAGDIEFLRARFGRAVSPGFDFERDLSRIGVANQTTMLSGESLAIAEEVRQSVARRYGVETRWRSTSAPSTRSARPPRNGRMRSWRCLRSRST